jgi:hypothetical protein
MSPVSGGDLLVLTRLGRSWISFNQTRKALARFEKVFSGFAGRAPVGQQAVYLIAKLDRG